MLEWLGVVAASVGTGVLSALVPVVNAEAALAVTAAASPAALAYVAAVFVGVGQTIGKIILFEAARRGREWRKDKPKKPREELPRWRRRLAEWSDRCLAAMHGRWRSNGVVLLSASVGIPPLLAVAVLAGAARNRRLDFAICCLVGRIARFLVVVYPFVLAHRS
ncbi:hypothetical protein [Solicola sp. PLA-1-18]|uniref:hypothetical protein n=1 Tax=Solicola sp. PLA-1-18 TaxID=3380532 RepID=UPI003B7E9971